MAEHTPGPWRLTERKGARRIIKSDDPERSIFIVESWTKLADANLIAAAPDLLEACKRMLRAHDENWATERMDFPPIDDVRAAIAKAEGGAK